MLRLAWRGIQLEMPRSQRNPGYGWTVGCFSPGFFKGKSTGSHVTSDPSYVEVSHTYFLSEADGSVSPGNNVNGCKWLACKHRRLFHDGWVQVPLEQRKRLHFGETVGRQSSIVHDHQQQWCWLDWFSQSLLPLINSIQCPLRKPCTAGSAPFGGPDWKWVSRDETVLQPASGLMPRPLRLPPAPPQLWRQARQARQVRQARRLGPPRHRGEPPRWVGGAAEPLTSGDSFQCLLNLWVYYWSLPHQRGFVPKMISRRERSETACWLSIHR